MPTSYSPKLAGEKTGKHCYECDTEMVYEEMQHSTIIDDSVIIIICPECSYILDQGEINV